MPFPNFSSVKFISFQYYNKNKIVKIKYSNIYLNFVLLKLSMFHKKSKNVVYMFSGHNYL